MGLGGNLKSMSARDAKNGFGLLFDTTRAEPVKIEKHGRAVVVVLSVEEHERLTAIAPSAAASGGSREGHRQSTL